MTNDLEIRIRDDRARGLLEAHSDGGEVLGCIAYFVLDDPAPALVAVHTAVEPAHEGKGLAGALATELYAVAAREQVAVAPLCPYVARWAERHPDLAPAAPAPLMDAAKEALAANSALW
ncbi:GNAT family N-acetyltransferase [Streptomyces sp. E11-3]|uniref:GNAT family N-acetyltransferase n=1 Tax=Streptomyces sp. E11-3 TaxID=3110112 RepID=UPI00398100BB